MLEGVLRGRSAAFLANDPLSFPRRYADPADREAAAVLAAVLAYGRVASIRASLEDLFGRMPQGPAHFIRGFEPRDVRRLAGFRHRFNTGDDIAALCWALRGGIEEAGSLEALFLAGDERESADIGAALHRFSSRLLQTDLAPLFGRRTPGGFSYLLPSPSGGSACKRLCMFLRWVCRPDDGVDLGLWKGVSPSRLVLPLDTHTARITVLLGLATKRTPGWKMALEATESLRRLDPADPIRFDFALSHLGISEGCTGKKGRWCLECAVKGLCRVS